MQAQENGRFRGKEDRAVYVVVQWCRTNRPYPALVVFLRRLSRR